MPEEPPSPQPRPSRRPGRPPGSVALTDEIEETIVSYVRAGAFAFAAAQAARISPRTFFDWMARGRGEHPERPATPKLRRFVARVEQALAQARVVAEARVYREFPRYWLAHAARSRPGHEGWTEHAPELQRPFITIEERLRELEETLRQRGIAERNEHRAACAGCSSPWHERSYDDDNSCILPEWERSD